MAFSRLINELEKNKKLFILLLFGAILLLRLPTLFNDYWDVDVLATIAQTKEFLAGGVPGTDFSENKHFLYHLIFKGAYSLTQDYGWVIVHASTILIVFLTSVFLYLTCKKLKNQRAGIIAALFYGVLISSFNRQFMATNGEIVYNLPIAMGLFAIVSMLVSSGRSRLIWFAAAAISAFLAFGIKFQGLIFAIFIAVLIFLYIPYYYKGIKTSLFIAGAAAAFLLFDFFVTGLAAPRIWEALDLPAKFSYSAAEVRGFSIFDLFIRYIHRQGMLVLWHGVLWIPAATYAFRFIRKGFRSSTPAESSVAVFFLVSYALIFAGGARMYFHYFMVPYTAGAVLAGFVLTDSSLLQRYGKKAGTLLLIPAAFFLAWNVKDIAIKHFAPGCFHNEGPFLYWTRAVLVGTFDDYLLPHSDYAEAVNFIKQNSEPEDRIFVWGDGPYLYYFSGRRMGAYTLWPKNTLHRISTGLKSENTAEVQKAEEEQSLFLSRLKNKMPLLFVDTSGNGLSTFSIALKDVPEINSFVMNKYRLIGNENKMRIFKLKDHK